MTFLLKSVVQIWKVQINQPLIRLSDAVKSSSVEWFGGIVCLNPRLHNIQVDDRLQGMFLEKVQILSCAIFCDETCHESTPARPPAQKEVQPPLLLSPSQELAKSIEYWGWVLDTNVAKNWWIYIKGTTARSVHWIQGWDHFEFWCIRAGEGRILLLELLEWLRKGTYYRDTAKIDKSEVDPKCHCHKIIVLSPISVTWGHITIRAV